MRKELGTALQAVIDKAAKMGVSVSRGAVEEMGEELVGGTVNHFAAALAKGRTWEEATASYLEGLPPPGAGQPAGSEPAGARTVGGKNAEPQPALPPTLGEVSRGTSRLGQWQQGY